MWLTDFLLARITEDETLAQGAGADPGDHWAWRDRLHGAESPDAVDADLVFPAGEGAWPSQIAGAHIARHDPARVLAECDAKRRIIEYCEMHVRGGFGPALGEPYRIRRLTSNITQGVAQDMLELLALPYSDHPDYDESWRP